VEQGQHPEPDPWEAPGLDLLPGSQAYANTSTLISVRASHRFGPARYPESPRGINVLWDKADRSHAIGVVSIAHSTEPQPALSSGEIQGHGSTPTRVRHVSEAYHLCSNDHPDFERDDGAVRP
jgi:hypothetical protein